MMTNLISCTILSTWLAERDFCAGAAVLPGFFMEFMHIKKNKIKNLTGYLHTQVKDKSRFAL